MVFSITIVHHKLHSSFLIFTVYILYSLYVRMNDDILHLSGADISLLMVQAFVQCGPTALRMRFGPSVGWLLGVERVHQNR